MPEKAALIRRVETVPYGTNAYVVSCPTTLESVLIDAPGESARILEELEGTRPLSILITHSHFDHTGALGEIADRLGIPVAAHAADASRLPRKPDRELQDGDRVTLGEFALHVLHTPGHTPGSLCFRLSDALFSGDTLFPGGPGRTASPADLRQIIASLEDKIFPLSDNTRVLPGHGEPTVLKKEKDAYAVFAGREHPRQLCGDVLWLSS
jgi:glyoxylase-like metal-dependent hydrolase (beta-lactamase superfamily II)